MKKILLTTFLAATILFAKAQVADTLKIQLKDTTVFAAVETAPEFPGGNDRFALYLAKTIRYPLNCYVNGIQGKVFVQMVIEQDGSVTNVKIVRSVSKELDAEALRVVGNSPKWNPAIQNGRAVRYLFTFPVTFKVVVQSLKTN